MKKSEKLCKAIGGLDEALIEEADRSRIVKASKKARKFTLKFTAIAAACLAAVIGVYAIIPRGISATALAEAVYPKATKYPGRFGTNSDAWYDDRNARRERGEQIGDKVNEFYKKTAAEFLSGDENRAYSPVNVYMTLAMLGETTDGESREQILDLLGAEDIEGLREDAKNMWLANYRDDGAVETILANSVWLNENIDIKQETPAALAENYYASSYSEDPKSEKMTKAVQTWLNKQTNGLLGDYVKDVKVPDDLVMALYSTVYFRAKWDHQFNKNKNDFKRFHAAKGDVQTEFMNATDTYGWFYAGEDFGAIRLYFDEGGAMWFILPDEDKTIDDVLNSGEYIALITMKNGLNDWEKKKSLKINYSVPKFDISSQIRLSEGIGNLGVTDVFDIEKADFSPLTDIPVFVSEAKHTARVVIDEEGCTATAFTEMPSATSPLPPEDEMDFIVDRPFIFAVTSDTAQPLFIGTVNDPA